MKNPTKTKRIGLSKKIRFEVFKRDKFCCSFCGKSAPDVILEVDHLKPVSKGGKNDILNLVTACFDCNRGKGKRELKDDSTLQKQLNQLEILQEKRSQFELMAKWRDELEKLDKQFIKYIEKLGNKLTGNNFGSFTDFGKKNLLKLRKKFTDNEIIESYQTSFGQYYKNPTNQDEIKEQTRKALDYVGRILSVKKLEKENPNIKDLFYCRAILRNKSNAYFNEWRAMQYLKNLLASGWDIEDIKEACKSCNGWSNFTQITQ
jgi:hypothetical protein